MSDVTDGNETRGGLWKEGEQQKKPSWDNLGYKRGTSRGAFQLLASFSSATYVHAMLLQDPQAKNEDTDRLSSLTSEAQITEKDAQMCTEVFHPVVRRITYSSQLIV